MTAVLDPPRRSRIWTPERDRVERKATQNRRFRRCDCCPGDSSILSSTPLFSSDVPGGSTGTSFSFPTTDVPCGGCSVLPYQWNVDFSDTVQHRRCPDDSPLCDLWDGGVIVAYSGPGTLPTCAQWSVSGTTNAARCDAGVFTACGAQLVPSSWSIVLTLVASGTPFFRLTVTANIQSFSPCGGGNSVDQWKTTTTVNCTSSNILPFESHPSSYNTLCFPISTGSVTITPA